MKVIENRLSKTEKRIWSEFITDEYVYIKNGEEYVYMKDMGFDHMAREYKIITIAEALLLKEN